MTAERIRLLDDRVVDQIAAGEVVERPASVVKELVENAIDARARSIEVHLEDGGRASIRVGDDGEGMGRQDAWMAIERHATSKIRTTADLDGIASFGFRGEALPSIAAVSRFQLTTRHADDESGTRIRIDAGKVLDVREVGAPIGTLVEVRSLFHAVPARRAFLRSAPTELQHCAEAVVRLALARPEIGFVLHHGPRTPVRSAASSSWDARLAELLGPDARDLIPIDAARDGVILTGRIAAPSVHRASPATSTYLYVRRRWVRDAVIRRAVQQAYRDRLPAGRHPLVVLDLALGAGAVDVNVHPTKAEVRFRDPAGIANFVVDALQDALGRRPRPQRPADLPLFGRVRALPPDEPPFPTPPSAEHRSPAEPPPWRELDPAPGEPPPWLAAEPPSPARATERTAPSAPTEPLAPGDAAPAVVGVVRERWILVHDLRGLQVVDGGRLQRLCAAARLGASRRLLVPEICPVPPAWLSRLEAWSDALEAAGLTARRFSATEVALSAVPGGFDDVRPAELWRLATQALAADGDIRSAWGERLSPGPIDDPAALLAHALRLGVAWPEYRRVDLP